MEAGRKFPTVDDVEDGRLELRPDGPQLDDVCKTVDYPVMQGPEILPKVNLAEEAANQSASLRHIAAIMSRMADFNISQSARRNFMEDRFFWHLQRASRWVKISIIVQTLSVLGAAAWVATRF